MPGERSMREVLRNLLQYGDLSFRDFVEVALYHPQYGYYQTGAARVGKEGDYVTSPTLSPVFAYAVGRLVREFLERAGDRVSTIVDVGCGDGSLIHALHELTPEPLRSRASFAGVDRSLDRLTPREGVQYSTTLDRVAPGERQLIINNELFDALPFARLVQRGEHLHELWVRADGEALDWSEHEAPLPYDDYFAGRGITLENGQFADISLEWEATYADLARWATAGLIVTFDYGYPETQLFRSRLRRFGTAAAYGQQRVTRDLLAAAGEQDLTAHINFTDLERAGGREGWRTLFFERQAKFLLALGITEHELFTPILDERIETPEEGVALLQAREDARRLILPDGIGHDIRVLVQAKGVEGGEWPFEKKLW